MVAWLSAWLSQVFGKVDECRKPSGDFRKRFIDYREDEEAPIDPITSAGSL